MNKIVKIFDNVDGFLSFDLRDILELINNGNCFKWLVQEMNFNIIHTNENLIELNDDDFNFIEFLNDKAESHLLTWDELLQLSRLNIQVVDGKIIGNSNNEKIEIRVIDSSYWIITTNDNSLFDKIKKRFNDITID